MRGASYSTEYLGFQLNVGDIQYCPDTLVRALAFALINEEVFAVKPKKFINAITFLKKYVLNLTVKVSNKMKKAAVSIM